MLCQNTKSILLHASSFIIIAQKIKIKKNKNKNTKERKERKQVNS